MVSAAVGLVIANQDMRAQPVSVKSLTSRVVPLMALCAMAEVLVSVINVSVRRDTSVHSVRRVLAAPTPVRPNCKGVFFILNAISLNSYPQVFI